MASSYVFLGQMSKHGVAIQFANSTLHSLSIESQAALGDVGTRVESSIRGSDVIRFCSGHSSTAVHHGPLRKTSDRAGVNVKQRQLQ